MCIYAFKLFLCLLTSLMSLPHLMKTFLLPTSPSPLSCPLSACDYWVWSAFCAGACTGCCVNTEENDTLCPKPLTLRSPLQRSASWDVPHLPWNVEGLNLVQITMTSMSSWLQQPCHVQRYHFVMPPFSLPLIHTHTHAFYKSLWALI